MKHPAGSLMRCRRLVSVEVADRLLVDLWTPEEILRALAAGELKPSSSED